jgi:hypothetical protein
VADRGTYIKMSDSLPEHRKIVAAGGDAGWLHVCALAYCSRNRTDGFFPADLVPRLSDRRQPVKLAAKLCDVHLWHAPGHDCKKCPQPPAGEYVVHDYLEHQRSAAKIAEISGKRAASGSRGGSKSRPPVKQSGSNLLRTGFADAQAKPTPDTEEVLRTSQTEEPLRGSQADTDVRPPAAAELAEATAQTLIGEWIDHCRSRPPGRVIGQVGKELRALLAEGIATDEVRRGLAQWHQRGLHPSALASAVNEVMNAVPASGATLSRRQQETDAMFDDALARARSLDAQEGRR